MLCALCRKRLPVARERCYSCQKPSPAGLTCRTCSSLSSLSRVQAAVPYDGNAKELVARLKFSGARIASRVMADSLAPKLDYPASRPPLIVPVPTAASRARGRGYDQAKLLARQLSRQSHLTYLDCLVRSGRTRQLGASRQQRIEQLLGAFRMRKPGEIQSRHILLIDDVITTGATLEAAAATLLSAGAGRIDAAVFAQA